MKILLGVTGSISAYKACDIISGFKSNGHEVKVIMTESAKQFITEMSLATISGTRKHRSSLLMVVARMKGRSGRSLMVRIQRTIGTAPLLSPP